MSKLIKHIIVPANVRKDDVCPTAINIYEDRVECEGGRGNILFFKDFTGISIDVASISCAFAGVIFLNSVSNETTVVFGSPNRIDFCSGSFTYAPANKFCQEASREIEKVFIEYQKAPSKAEALPTGQSSSLEIMNELIKHIIVPANVRKNDVCPTAINIYEDRVECEGGCENVLFFKDFTGISIDVASISCAFAGVIFLNSVSNRETFNFGSPNRIDFCSGIFTYAPANKFCQEVSREIEKVFVEYKKAPSKAEASPTGQSSPLDEIKKLKELLEIDAITQEEFQQKKAELLSRM